MSSSAAEQPGHRSWIRRARQQSDEAERARAEIALVSERPEAALLAADFFPGYELQREIHRGAQGAVYRAVQKSTGKSVALKLLHGHALGGPLERARFEREMRALAALQHPNIVAIHDGGSHDGRFFLVMDYIAGQPLDAYMAGRRRSIRETLDLFIAICDAVNAAHVRGIIHRDLKPANVRVDEAGRPFVLDFGLAKLMDDASGNGDQALSQPMTQTGQFLGTLPWAAPEQAAGSPSRIDIRTDVYSLGVLLYHMLTGKLPYAVGGPMKQALEAILHSPPAALRGLRREIDDELETIALKCLSKESDRRYQTAGELARDLRRYLAGEAIEAKRDSGWYRARVFLRRNRWPVGGAVAFVLVLLGAFGFSLAQWRAAVRDRDRAALAEKQEEQARQRAESHNHKLQRVNRFVQDLLAGADPHALPTDEVSARTLLDNASRDIEAGELRDQPEVEAAVRTTVGRAYTTLGRYDTAGVHLETALRLVEQMAVPDAILLGDALSALAHLRIATQEVEAAESLARRALAARQAAYGNAHEEVAAAWDTLGEALYAAGRHGEGAEAMRHAVATFRAALGERDPQVAAAVARLAMHAHDPTESAELLKQAVGQFEQVGELRNMDYGMALSNLAQMQHLGRAYADAEANYLRAVAVFRDVFGGPNLYVLNTLDNLTLLCLQSGNSARALETTIESLEAARTLFGEDSPRTAQALIQMATACRRLGQDERGLKAAQEALEIHERLGNGRTVDGLHARLGLAVLALRCGQTALAESAARECLEAPEDVLAMPAWRKPLAQSVLGAALSERGEFAAAEPLLIAGFEGLTQTRNRPPESVESAGQRLVQLYERWDVADPGAGRAAAAEAWRARLAELSRPSKDD